jgi:ribose/xylose/arabinose/galactoside ABC-type transport system permease subunit
MTNDSRLTSHARRAFDQLGPLMAMAAVWSLFAALRWNTFATWNNTQSILLQTAVVGIAALGGTMIIISGGIDLSVGSLIALVSVIVAYVISKGVENYAWASQHPDLLALAASAVGVLVAMACGLAIGAMVVGRIGRVAAAGLAALGVLLAWRFGLDAWRGWAALGAGVALAAVAWWIDRRLEPPLVLSPFIVTLGAWGAFRGMAKGLADNSAIYLPPTFDSRLLTFMRLPADKVDAALAARPWHWWSPGVWIFLALSVLVAMVLRYTQFGRHVYAIGSNEQTARLCGIQVERNKVRIYMFALALAGVAGVLQFSFNTMGDPNTANGYELQVIAAVVIGGASLSGGVGGVLGTVAGALMMTIIDNGCTKVGLENWMQEILTGGIIVAAVALDQLRHRGSA